MKVPAFTELWSVKLCEKFTTLTVATLFRAKGQSLILGCEDGMIRLHDISTQPPSMQPQTILETKSGPIQCLSVHDVTKFYHNDLIVGDSCGMLIIFCNQQILSRQNISSDSLVCVTVMEEEGSGAVIVTSNDSGVISGVSSTSELWRINLNSLSNKNPSTSVKISCLLHAHMTEANGNKRKYILAADNAKRIHIICQGSIVSSLDTPANVTAMAQGRFVSTEKLNLPLSSFASSQTHSQQIALGCNNGAIYIMHQFNVTSDEFVNAKTPITNLWTLKDAESNFDVLLCAGHFSALHMYKEGQLAFEYSTSDWVGNIATADIDGDNSLEVIIGCMDGTVTALKI